MCSTPAVYAVACFASSQPAAILDCTGSTIDLAREAIDETTAAPVELPRCEEWEAAMLWAAAIASIATIGRAAAAAVPRETQPRRGLENGRDTVDLIDAVVIFDSLDGYPSILT